MHWPQRIHQQQHISFKQTQFPPKQLWSMISTWMYLWVQRLILYRALHLRGEHTTGSFVSASATKYTLGNVGMTSADGSVIIRPLCQHGLVDDKQWIALLCQPFMIQHVCGEHIGFLFMADSMGVFYGLGKCYFFFWNKINSLLPRTWQVYLFVSCGCSSALIF